MIDNRYEYGRCECTFLPDIGHTWVRYSSIRGLRVRDIADILGESSATLPASKLARRGRGRNEARELLDYNTRGIDWSITAIVI